MRTMLCLLMTITTVSALADEFYLDDAKGKTHGPFRVEKGTKVQVGKESATISRVKTEHDALVESMKKIKIPEVAFRQADISGVVMFLQNAVKKYGKEEIGIVLRLWPDTDTSKLNKVTFTARYISLYETIKIIAQIMDLRERISGTTVILEPLDMPDGPIIRRLYRVKPTYMEGTIRPYEQVPNEDTPQSREEDQKAFFAAMGVGWPRGASIKYMGSVGKLAVANTASNLKAFEVVLAIIDVVPTQLEIDVHFVAFDKADIAKLAQTEINMAGLMDLWTNGRAELLAAPKVVTKSGVEGVTKGVTEYIYPTEFTVLRAPGTNTNTTAEAAMKAPAAEASGFEMREVGVILEVAPDVSPEGDLIDMTLTPQLVREPTWEDYGGKCVTGDGREWRLQMRQPFFPSYVLSTSVSVMSGKRVLIGGGTPTRDGKKVVYVFATARNAPLKGWSVGYPVTEGAE